MIHLRHQGYIATSFPWERAHNNQVLHTTAAFGFYCLFTSPNNSLTNPQAKLLKEIVDGPGWYDFFNKHQTALDQSVKETLNDA